MFNIHDEKRDAFMLNKSFGKKGYDWWWHSFTAVDVETGEEKSFFIEFFVVNPKYGRKYPVFGQTQGGEAKKTDPLMFVSRPDAGERTMFSSTGFTVSKRLLSNREPLL